MPIVELSLLALTSIFWAGHFSVGYAVEMIDRRRKISDGVSK